MATQLTFDFSSPLERQPIPWNETWLDMSDIARGVGFTTTVLISPSLEDVLRMQGDDYDQRLYDALWAAHFRLYLGLGQSVTFSFSFRCKTRRTDEEVETNVRLRAETQPQTVLLGRLEDFPNEPQVHLECRQTCTTQ